MDENENSFLTPDERAEVLNAIIDAVEPFGLTVGGYDDTDGVFFKVLIMEA